MTDRDGIPQRIEAFRSFRAFLAFCWDRLGLPEPTRIQYNIASKLEEDDPRQIIEGFRGVAKSWITGCYALWRLYWDVTLNILIASATEQRALDQSQFILRLISEVPEFQWLHPENRPPTAWDVEPRMAKRAFDVGPAPISQAPSVKSVGIFGQLVGSRADIIIADDIETSRNALTEVMRVKLSSIIREFDAILKPGAKSKIIFLCTPQSEESIYIDLYTTRGYSLAIWPSEYPNRRLLGVYGEHLAPMLRRDLEADPSLLGPDDEDQIGVPTEPSRFPVAELMARKQSWGRSGYNLQYRLDPSGADADRHPFRLKDLIVADVPDDQGPITMTWCAAADKRLDDLGNPGFRGDGFHAPFQVGDKFATFEDSLLFVDPAGRGKDETAYVVVKTLNGRIFLMEVGGFTGGYERETLEAIARKAKRHKVKRVVAEDDFGDGMFGALLRPVLAAIYQCGLEGVKVDRIQKELRIIRDLEPVVDSHRLVVVPSAVEADRKPLPGVPAERQHEYSLFYQLTHLTKDKGCLAHDDRLDALAGAVKCLQTTVETDSEKNKSRIERDLLGKAAWEEAVKLGLVKGLKKPNLLPLHAQGSVRARPSAGSTVTWL